ncbi:cilia- and flagella-associated protein 157-like [Cherax quadricarinatus]|uniref:cilia- and flagella-associated protein 157-like n=1 Tax=Cherax quadricarinatus TaxID=27406 RepID=UPI00387E3D46
MAPKGKKGGKKKGGKKKDKKEDDEDLKPKEAVSELDKHYYLNQIQALEVKLKRTTTRCEQLDDAEKHARTQYDKLHTDKNDIITFLKDRYEGKDRDGPLHHNGIKHQVLYHGVLVDWCREVRLGKNRQETGQEFPDAGLNHIMFRRWSFRTMNLGDLGAQDHEPWRPLVLRTMNLGDLWTMILGDLWCSGPLTLETSCGQDHEPWRPLARLSRLAKEAENTRLDLNDKIIALTRKLESLEEFRQHKEELEDKLRRLQKELKDCQASHQEKVSYLEKSSLVEAAALRAELEARVTRITEDLRRAAQTEVHSTTRRALHENEALTKQLEVFREKLGALREENQDLREALSDSQVREGVLQDTVRRVTGRGERLARLLQAVTERSENHTHVWKDYDRLSRENHQLRRDLQAMQGQLDVTTQATCELREKAVEKDVALELTATHLRQENAARKTLQDSLSAALSLLHHAVFTEEESGDKDSVTGVLQQLVSLLSFAEAAHQHAEEGRRPPGRGEGVEVAEKVGGPGQIKYRAGDLGLLPRPHRKAKPTLTTDN